MYRYIHIPTLILIIISLTAPPSYAEVVSEEQFEERRTSTCQPQPDWLLDGPAITYIQQFCLQPPPSYSEVSHSILSGTPLKG